ncbi:hypothetical protein BGZ54_007287 [Gamsiella multidivaricata]|nr:hypothetical protein BGZ54_007287 [Gamsiella multidivaricata]
MVAHIIGTHGDYVKTLAYASGPGWVASGGLDKTVNIWDIKEGRSGQFGSLGSIPETSSKASIYALACNPAGTVLATGSPEKILSASSDTTIKLWSLTAQRCITTFTMHSDSVWSLHSDHPQLATFYGGGKDGLVTKTEINRYNSHHHNDYEDEDPGQCVVICKAETGVARLVAHDDARIWTATSSSSVYQWPDIPTRSNRSHELTASIVPANLLKMNLNESTFMEPIPEHYYPTSTVYSAASLGSLFINNRDKQSQHSSEDDEGLITPIFEGPENVIEGEHGLIKHTLLNNRRMVVTEDKCGEVALWDIIKCVQLETFTGRKLEDVVNELNTIESVPTWCTIDTRIGALTVHLDEARCFDAEVYVDEIEKTPDPERPEDQRIIIGKWVLKNLFESYIPVHIDAYEKEAYRIQHQDDPSAQVLVPTTVVTNERNEVIDGGNNAQADDSNTASNARPTINTSPEGLKRERTDQPTSSGEASKANSTPSMPQDNSQQPQQSTGTAPSSSSSPKQGPTSTSSTVAAVTKLIAPPSSSNSSSVSSTPLSPANANSGSSNGFMGRLKHSVKKLARTPSAEQRFENGRPVTSRKSFSIPTSATSASKAPHSPSIPENPSPSLPTVTTTSALTGSAAGGAAGTALGTATATATATTTEAGIRTGTTTGTTTGTGTGIGTGATTSAASSPRTTIVEGTPTVGPFGPEATKPEDDQSSVDTSSSNSVESMPSTVMQLPSSTISVRPPHPPFTPPTHLDCPAIEIPAHIPVIISEQSREASSSVDLYRGSVGSLAQDYVPLVQVIPTWLLDMLLKNMIPMKEGAKVSFVLRPHHDQEMAAAPGGPGRLGELPGGNPRLTAPRMLRVRKVVTHVVDKMALTPPERIFVATVAPLSAGAEVGQQDDAQARLPLEPVREDSKEDSDYPILPPRTSSIIRPSDPDTLESSRASVSRTQPSSDGTDGPVQTSPSNASFEQAQETVKPPKTKEEEEEEEYMRQEMLRPENWLEILCNDQVLSPTTTLATIRTHYWKTGSDVVLTYRYKHHTHSRAVSTSANVLAAAQ